MRILTKILLAFLITAPPAWAQMVMPLSVPLYFEADSDRTDEPAQFIARGSDYQFLISPTCAQIALSKVSTEESSTSFVRAKLFARREISLRSVRMQFVGANPQAQIEGAEVWPGKINYLVGNDPAQWRTSVPMFAKVRVEQMYPGINLVYYGNQQRLEYDFTIAPRADMKKILIRFDGADKVSTNARGELVLKLGKDEIHQPAPDIYQMVAGSRKEISGGYKLLDKQTVTFAVGEYDRNLPLIIDPVLSYSTYFGGKAGDLALSVKVDTNGFVYVAGETLSTQLPTTSGSFQTNFGGGSLTGDAFVAKFDKVGTNLVYLTYLGGKADDGALSMDIDSAGDVYLTGFTQSPNFPIVQGIFTNINGPFDAAAGAYPADAFVAELNTNGSGLIYSTYLGGNNNDAAKSIAVDSAGAAYVAGYTTSTNFPTTTNAIQRHLACTNSIYNANAFVTKIAPGGSALTYSTYLGGTNFDEAQGVAVDALGSAYVTGYTDSTNFPNTNALQTLLNGVTNATVSAFDAFVSKLNPAGSALEYSTFLGGTNSDFGLGIAADAAGNAYIVGTTQSPGFPNTATNVNGLYEGVINNTNGLPLVYNAFLTKLDPTGTNIVYSALFGGTNVDVAWHVAVDPVGNAFVTGSTTATNFPTVNTLGYLSPTNSGGTNVFVTAFNTNCSSLLYSAYIGGSYADLGYGIAVDSLDNAYIVGQASSPNFPTVDSYQSALSGGSDAFIAKIVLNPSSPQIITQPTNQNVGTGATVMFNVSAIGTPPLNFQWQLNGTNLTNGVITGGSTISGATTVGTATNSTLTIFNAQTNDSGNYSVIITNYSDSITSSIAVLTVSQAPVITVQPTNQTVGRGSTVIFSVNGNGTPPFSLQWLKDGTDLANGTNGSGSVISGSTNSAILTVHNAQTNDDGNYFLIVTNNWGSATSAVATLTVLLSPSFSSITAVNSNGAGSFILSGVGGTNAGAYYVLTSTNLATPLAQWTPIATNQFGNQGQFVFTNTAPTNTPQQFYLLRM